MNPRKLFFLVFIFTGSITAMAEVGVTVGARAGFNIAHMRKFTPPDLYNKRVIMGADLAAVLRIDFTKNFGFQTEVEFTQKGQGWKRTQDSAHYSGKLIANYVQFPLLAVGRVGSEKYKAVFLLGPYFAYWTGGYTQQSVSVDHYTLNAQTVKYEYTKNDNRFDVGWVTAAGADFKVGKGWIELMARHNLGFLSMAKKNSGLPNTYTCNFSLSLGYRYTIK